jgi:hypothetical protein
MNNLKQLAVVTILAAMACTGLLAQTVDMTATIPFDFQAGNKLMPAGEYQVHEQGTWVILRSLDGSKSVATVLTNAATGADRNRDARIEFHRYGGAYFLTTIWYPYSGDGRDVPQTSRERELAKRYGAPSKSAVVLAVNNNK